MARQVIATKLYAPRPRHELVARPRLRALLRRAAGSRLTLVSAPAGFGKTTLLAEWLASPDAATDGAPAVAWLSLDAEDADPGWFWTCVVAALRTAVLGEGSAVPALLEAPSVSVDQVLTALLNELADVPGPVWLVLDDYHLVAGPAIDAGLRFFLEHLPAQVHVVLCTRADPDLPLPRWRARGELTELRAADLRFTADEAAAYLNDVAGLRLTTPDVAALQGRTEGWIAALQLAALSLQGREDASGFIAGFAGDDRYVVDYLVEEVLRHHGEPVRSFLLRTAVLDRLTGPLCDAVTGRDDGAAMLADLERANLFLVALDDRRTWLRYQHLFADVLRARLLAEEPDLAGELHRRAARWFEAHDVVEDAVRHALAGGDVDAAVRLAEVAAPAIRRNRHEALLLGWLAALPQDAVRRSPVLSVFHAYRLMLSGALDDATSWLDDAERALAAIADGSAPAPAQTDELRTLPATIAVYRAALAQARGDVEETAAHARRGLALAGPDDHLSRGSAAGFLGLAAWAAGDVPQAIETFGRAVASLHAAGALVDALSSTVILADLWLAAGRPGTARQLHEEALATAQAHGDVVARAAADLHVGLAELDVERDDLDAARRHLETASASAERSGTTDGHYRWYVAASALAAADGDPSRAVALLDTAQPLFRPGFFPDVRPIPALRARIRIRQGQLDLAAQWARERGLLPVPAEASVGYLGEFDRLTLVRLLIARHRIDPTAGTLGAAAEVLDRLLEPAESSGRAGSVLELRLLAALVLDARGERSRAVADLARALAQAPDPTGYRRLFLDEGAAGAGLLAEATAGRAPVAGPLSEREVQVLRLLDSDLTAPQIATELFVSLNTVRTHTKHIFSKLDVTTRRAAVRRGRELGLL